MKNNSGMTATLPRRNFLGNFTVGAAAMGLAPRVAGAAQDQTVIDEVHHHVVAPEYITSDSVRAGWTNWSPDKVNGRALVSFSACGASIKSSEALARRCNEHSVNIVSAYEDRFIAIAGLPDLRNAGGVVTEIEHSFALGMAGVTVMTSYGDQWLSDRAFDPVFKELDRRHALVFVQPSVQNLGSSTPVVKGSRVAQQLDAASFVSDLQARWSGIRFVAASTQLGSGVPVHSYWWGMLPQASFAPPIRFESNFGV